MEIQEIELQREGRLVHYAALEEDFWDRYRKLWTNSLQKSPFQSPNFLRSLIGHDQIGEVICYQFFIDDNLRGSAFFQKRKGVYQFLSDIRTDHNFFILHQDCPAEEIRQFFTTFFQAVREARWTLTLNYQPIRSGYWKIQEEVMRQEKFFLEYFQYSVYPVMDSPSPEALAKRLTKSKSTKYYKNKLNKEHGAEFEVLRGEEDLDAWTQEFADAHIRRWGITNTPSEYNDPACIQLFKDAMRAWIKDGILYRFAIKTNEGKRIAFCVCMDEEDSFLYHTQTYDLDFSDYRLGTVLLSFLGEWMGEKGFSRLDFGDGDESYKFRYANEELPLNRVFIAPYYQVVYILKAKVIKFVRQNDELYKNYVAKVKPLWQDFSFGGLVSLLKELLTPERQTKKVEKTSK
jgi:hypothetical protein